MVRSWFTVFVTVLLASIACFYNNFFLGLIVFISLIIISLLNSPIHLEMFSLSIIGILALLFFNLSFIKLPANLPTYEHYQATGYIANYPTYDGKRGSFILHTNDPNIYKKKIQVFTSFDTSVKKGDKVLIQGSLDLPLSPGNPGEFDYKSYLAKEKIFYILNINNTSGLTLIEASSNVVYKMSSGYREQFKFLTNKYLNSNAAGILLGMLLGEKEGIDETQYDEFQKTGIVHVFAVSGLHIGFLLLFCHGICVLLGLSFRVKFYLSILLLLLYGTLVGWPISVIRASLMAGLGIFALYIKRDKNLLNSLGLAGIIIILLDPYAPFKIAFQLSFATTWGLVYLYPLLKEYLSINNKLIEYSLIPLCAQIPAIPLIAYHFNLITPVALISNILLGYLIGVIVMIGFVLMIIAILWSFLFEVIGFIVNPLIEIVLLINNLLAKIPYAYINVATPNLITVGLYYLGLALVIYWLLNRKERKTNLAGIVLILVALSVMCLPASIYNRGKMEVVFLDVGQGDSILLKSPQGKFILVDGGGSEFTDVGKRKVVSYLHHRGIRKLFFVVNTHPDTDHLRGLETVVTELPVNNIGLPYTLRNSNKYNNLNLTANKKNISIIPLYENQQIKIENDFKIKVLNPSLNQEGDTNPNDQSVILLTQYRNFSVLLTGDVEKSGIERLLKNENISSVTVLKIPHHGSKHSLNHNLYIKTRPIYAVISVGKNNFGHPHSQVIDALKAHKIIPLRTDDGGAICFESDGYYMLVSRPMMD